MEKAGFYQVSVLKNDLPAATATFNVESKENPNQGNTSNQPTNPSSSQTGSVFGDLFSNPFVIGGIIIVIAIAIIGLFTMKK